MHTSNRGLALTFGTFDDQQIIAMPSAHTDLSPERRKIISAPTSANTRSPPIWKAKSTNTASDTGASALVLTRHAGASRRSTSKVTGKLLSIAREKLSAAGANPISGASQLTRSPAWIDATLAGASASTELTRNLPCSMLPFRPVVPTWLQ